VGTDKRERQKANRERARQDRIRKQQRNKLTKRGLIFGLGIPAIVLALFAVSWATGGDDAAAPAVTTIAATDTTTAPTDTAGDTTTTVAGKTPAIVEGTTTCPKTDGSQKRVAEFSDSMKKCIDPAKTYTATFNTSEGAIVVALNAKAVPGTVNNFVSLSRYKYYDGTTIFRTDPSIDIIQGGGFSASDSIGYTIKDEGGPFAYSEGDLVMARTGAPDSAGAQFFFVTGPKASALDSQGTYVTFGKVTKGLDVIKKIIGLHEATTDGLGGKPSRAVTVKTITIAEK
jgi:cyclophilin family peptidyl-prolyl cis-trans isomerase